MNIRRDVEFYVVIIIFFGYGIPCEVQRKILITKRSN